MLHTIFHWLAVLSTALFITILLTSFFIERILDKVFRSRGVFSFGCSEYVPRFLCHILLTCAFPFLWVFLREGRLKYRFGRDGNDDDEMGGDAGVPSPLRPNPPVLTGRAYFEE